MRMDGDEGEDDVRLRSELRCRKGVVEKEEEIGGEEGWQVWWKGKRYERDI